MNATPFPPLRVVSSWPTVRARPARPFGSLPDAPPATPAPAPAAPLPPDFVLAVGDATADADALLGRITPVGLTEQALLLALNQGDAAALRRFAGFGPKVAEKIVAFRQAETFFSSLDELVRVPLIGPTRFRRLVGRDSLFFSHPLHSTLRQPLTRTLRVADLQPLNWPAPGVPRLFLGAAAHTATERATASRQRHHLHQRRLGPHILFLHLTSPDVTGWAAHLVAALPRALRRILTPSPSP